VLASLEREDVITELVVPEVAVEPVAKLLRLPLLVGGEFVVAPELAGEPSGAQPGVVGVAWISQVAIGPSAGRPSANWIESSESFQQWFVSPLAERLSYSR